MIRARDHPTITAKNDGINDASDSGNPPNKLSRDLSEMPELPLLLEDEGYDFYVVGPANGARSESETANESGSNAEGVAALQKLILQQRAQEMFLVEQLESAQTHNERRRVELCVLKRSLRALHAQRPPECDTESSALTAQLISALESLDQLAVEYSRQVGELEEKSKDFCLLKARHAHLVKAARQSKDFFEKSLEEALEENENLKQRCNNLESLVLTLEEEQTATNSQLQNLLKDAENAREESRAEIESLEKKRELAVNELRRSHDQLRNQQAVTLKTAEGKKIKDDHIRRLMLLVAELEHRNATLLRRQEAMDEELTEQELTLTSVSQQLLHKDFLVLQLDQHCSAYEKRLEQTRQHKPSHHAPPPARAPPSVSSAPSPALLRPKRDAGARRGSCVDRVLVATPVSRTAPLPSAQRRSKLTAPSGDARHGPDAARRGTDGARRGTGRGPPQDAQRKSCWGDVEARAAAARAATARRERAGEGEGRAEDEKENVVGREGVGAVSVRVERRRGAAPETAIRARALQELGQGSSTS